MAMCEQEWVTQRIYRRCEDGAMDCFSSHQLRKNCLVCAQNLWHFISYVLGCVL